MLLSEIQAKCLAVRELCTERYASMPCVRKLLHDFSAVELINKACPCEIIQDSHAFCTAYAECEEVDLIVQRHLEGL